MSGSPSSQWRCLSRRRQPWAQCAQARLDCADRGDRAGDRASRGRRAGRCHPARRPGRTRDLHAHAGDQAAAVLGRGVLRDLCRPLPKRNADAIDACSWCRPVSSSGSTSTGRWILGLACWGCWLLGAAWSTPHRRRLLISLGIATLLATLVNPYGVGIWRFLGETVRPARHDITDWKPLLQLPVGIIVLNLVLPAIALCACVARRARVPLSHVAIIGLLAFGTWRVGRVDAFLQAAIGLLLAPQILSGFAALRSRLQSPIWLRPAPFGRALLGAATVAALTVGLMNIRTIDLQGAWLPDEYGTESVRRACSGARLLTWFDWGEYAIWHLAADGVRVSMDGRRETIYSSRRCSTSIWRSTTTIVWPSTTRIASRPSACGCRRGWTRSRRCRPRLDLIARSPISSVLRRAPNRSVDSCDGRDRHAAPIPGP